MPRTTQATAGTRPGYRRKVQVAPFTWEFPPGPKLFPIFEIVGTRAGVNWKDRTLYLSPEGCDLWGSTWKGYQVADLVARFNAGERWLAKKEPGQVASTA